MIYFCPNCWQEVPEACKVCPVCDFDLQQANQRSFEEKLIAALHHPEPETPIRVAQILARMGHRDAVQPLLHRAEIELQKQNPDPYLLAALLKAARALQAPIEKWEEILDNAHSKVLRALLKDN